MEMYGSFAPQFSVTLSKQYFHFFHKFQSTSFNIILLEAVTRLCLEKKTVLKIFAKFTGKHLHQSIFSKKRLAPLLRDTPTQIFSCEFY